MAFLIIFSDWRIFVSAITVVAVHHISFYFLQVNNTGIYIFDESRLAFSTVIIHAIYAIVEAVISAFIARDMYNKAMVGKELSSVTQQLIAHAETVDLKIRCNSGKSDVLMSFNKFLEA